MATHTKTAHLVHIWLPDTTSGYVSAKHNFTVLSSIVYLYICHIIFTPESIGSVL